MADKEVRLIDANALKAKFCNHCDERDCKPDATDTVYGCVIADTIDNMPTIEAEPDKGWISVKKGFPCYDEEVLVYTENGCTVDFCDCDGDWNLDLDIGAVTHWRPLPEKPKGE